MLKQHALKYVFTFIVKLRGNSILAEQVIP